MGLVLCIDLALTNTGFVVAEVRRNGDRIKHVGLIKTPSSSPKKAKQEGKTMGQIDWDRSQLLAIELLEQLDLYQIDHVYVECPTGGSKSSRAAKAMALAKGSAAAVMLSRNVPVTLFTPQQAKKAATGNTSADKDDVKSRILVEFKYFKNWIKSSKGRLIKTANEHIFDACSVLMCARQTESYKELQDND